MSTKSINFRDLPGSDLVRDGLSDLEKNIRSENALLVSIAGPRLRGLGLPVPTMEFTQQPYEHELFGVLEERLGPGAHAAYNALIGRIVSFANAYTIVRD